MCGSPSRGGWLPIALAPDHGDLELGHPRLTGIEALGFPCRRKSGLWYNVWTNEAALVHPTPLAHLAALDRYFDAVLLASSLSNRVANTCFALPTCGTALAWSTLEGLPTTIIATIPMG